MALLLIPTSPDSKTITGAKYAQEVLRGRLAGYTRELKRRIWQPALVVEDNAPVHNAGVATAARIQLKIDRLAHPPSSPDLNPIENLWSIVKYKVAQRNPRATNLEQLYEQVQEAWEKIPMEVVNNVIDSMEARRQAVIASRGHQTRY